MLKLDGSHGEGGGSIVRVALALSTYTSKPFTINNIRSKRPKPGLKQQHLYCINALKKLSNAKCEDSYLGSEAITFYPNPIEGKTLSIDIRTAGSITLFLQALLLPSIFSEKKVRIKITGGTDVKWAMPIDFLKEVFLPQLMQFADIELKVLRRGYYPKGNGSVDITIKKKDGPIKPYNLLQQPELIQIKGISHASSSLHKNRVAERQAKTAKLSLSKLNVPIQIHSEYNATESTGSGITLWAVFSRDPDEIDIQHPTIIGADCLGEKTKSAEIVGQEAASKLIEEIDSKACIDQHAADQLLQFLAVTGGAIKTSTITEHMHSNIYVIEKFLGKKFSVKQNIITSQ